MTTTQPATIKARTDSELQEHIAWAERARYCGVILGPVTHFKGETARTVFEYENGECTDRYATGTSRNL